MKTEVIKVNSSSDPGVKKAAELLKKGEVVAIPTETVYGLAANAFDEKAVEKIFIAKGRPSDNPLIVHISELSQWAELVESIPENALALARAFWPGPLTIILKKSSLIPLRTSGGLDTVGVRMPLHPTARAIISAAGVPLAAPSANNSGKPSTTTAEHCLHDLDGKIPLIIDSGECSVGVESTVVTLVPKVPRVLRPGGISLEMLADVLGKVEVDDAVLSKLADGAVAASPGMKYKHYSPNAKVSIVKGSFESFKTFVEAQKEKDVLALVFEGEGKKLSVPFIEYGKENDGASQARKIFSALRRVDETGAKLVYARFPEKDGVGLAVLNRLIRAAAFNIIEL
ncbi:MAG: threonylcarbamoyl-AMP synthase [Oscillospiraceae bacterium]|nr:threonylcarbamoyl-AMP synthase [Oscillospiraceae bacterium]MDD7293275.1 L-threonylcarbamoyladenylate synthase [Clostridiaceae bacterium]